MSIRVVFCRKASEVGAIFLREDRMIAFSAFFSFFFCPSDPAERNRGPPFVLSRSCAQRAGAALLSSSAYSPVLSS